MPVKPVLIPSFFAHPWHAITLIVGQENVAGNFEYNHTHMLDMSPINTTACFTMPFSAKRENMYVTGESVRALCNIRSYVFRFLSSNIEDTFFSTADRSRMVYDILQRTGYHSNEAAVDKVRALATAVDNCRGQACAQVIEKHVGIEHLVKKQVYTSAFPLHEVSAIALL